MRRSATPAVEETLVEQEQATDDDADIEEVVDLEPADVDDTEEEWIEQANASIMDGDEVYEGDAIEDEDLDDDTADDVADAESEPLYEDTLSQTTEDEPLFVMPEQADYEPEVALVSVPDGMTADELNEVLSAVDGVSAVQANDEDSASGLFKVELEPGVSVEEAVNDLLATGAIDGAQPNYRYQVTGAVGTPADLRALLAASTQVIPYASDGQGDGQESLTSASDGLGDQDATGSATTDEGVDIDSDTTAADGQEETLPEDDLTTQGDPDVVGDVVSSEPSEEGDDSGEMDVVPTDDTDTPAESDGDEYGDSNTEPDTTIEDDVDSDVAENVEQDGDDSGEQGEEPAIEDLTEGETPATEAQSEDEGEGEDKANEDAEDKDKDKAKLGAAGLAADLVNDPSANKQWALDAIHVGDAWRLIKCKGEVTVAVMDEGFNVQHEDLASNVVAPYNAAYNTTEVDAYYSNHGNHVAGIIAAVANNKKGVAGVSYNAKIMPIAVVNESGMADTAVLVRAFQRVVNKKDAYKIRVVNLSMSREGEADWFTTDDELLAAIDAAYAAGIVTVCAAGNSSGLSVPYISYPSDYETAVSVINLTDKQVRSSTSNYNLTDKDCKNISAPGTNIYSTFYSGYSTMSGTSMATPVVSAVLALEFAARPSLTPEQAVQILYASATDIGSPGWDRETGHGEVDAFGAVASAADGAISGPAYMAAGGSATYRMVGTNVSFSYTSSNTSVATITSTGKVSAVGEGTTTITAKSSKGDIARTVKLTVFKSVSGADSLAVPSKTTLRVLKPVSMAWKWKSSNTNVATVGATSGVVAAVSPGKATITATLVADTSVKLTKTITVSKGNLAKATISAVDDKTYTGKAIKPSPAVKMGSTKLVKGTDYELSYTSNTAIGKATITITGKGKYTGTRKLSFKIVAIAPAKNLTGWYSPDLGKTYYWYRNGKKRTEAGWVVTKLLPKGGSDADLQRYWLGKGGKLAMGRLVKPSEGSGFWAYARSTGYVVRGRYRLGKLVYFANNKGKLLSPGWHTTSDFGQGKRRYYIEKSTRSAIVGYSTAGYAHYTNKAGYVLCGVGRVKSLYYIAYKKTGKLVNRAGWIVGDCFGQGMRRYYLHKQKNGSFAAQAGYSKAGWPHYTTNKGYVLCGELISKDGYTYIANNDGLVTSRKKSQ